MFYDSVQLEIIAALLVFSLGIPAFVYQIIVSGELRRIINKYSKIVSGFYFLVSAFIVTLVLYLWVYQPTSQDLSQADRLFPNLTLTVLFICFVIYVKYVLTRISHEKVVFMLEAHIRSRIRHEYRIDNKAIQELVFLGKNHEGGFRKEIVLIALLEIVKDIMSHDEYKGDNLEKILQELNDVVLQYPHIGDDNNFLSVIAIWVRIITNSKVHSYTSSVDMNYIGSQMSLFSKKAIELSKGQPVITKLIDLSYTKFYQNLFIIGKVALDRSEYSYALEALNRYEHLVELEKPPLNCTISLYIGFLSYFYYNESQELHNRALLSITNLSAKLTDWDQHCENASQYFKYELDFETLEHISKLRQAPNTVSK